MEPFDVLHNVIVKLGFDEVGGQADGVLDGLGRTGAVRFDADPVDAEQHRAAIFIGIDFAFQRPEGASGQ